MSAVMLASAVAEPVARIREAPAAPAAAFLTVGIDVGGTKIATVVTDAADELLFHDVVATNRSALAEQIVDVARRAIAGASTRAGGEAAPVAAIGVAIPGQVEPRRGTAELAVNLGAPGIDLGTTVEEGTGLPCFVEHDARAAAAWVYERREGGAQDGADLCYLSIGTGIAAGIVLGGRPLSGASGLAGEVGHMIVDPGGRVCPCGSVGCLETVAAGPAIARAAREQIAAGRSTSLQPNPTAADVFNAAASGDGLALEIAQTVAQHLARTVRGLVLTLGVQRVVIGGGVAASGDAFMNPILDELRAERARSPLVETAFADASLELLPPDLEPGARGAAAIARQRINAQRREGVADR
jgi:predicted NBD/HSP70 family sugar kinase